MTSDTVLGADGTTIAFDAEGSESHPVLHTYTPADRGEHLDSSQN